ncbi:unnamed protein product [Cylicocyclus nassatus]|uniref:Uncharacterized protein n=1 Tax=Cylicocyclus nassatus TaxID=53992 RepID=A0AA36H9F7_CYLNA|nr:unnamed protein product [Cylicocyclus nassatus]
MKTMQSWLHSMLSLPRKSHTHLDELAVSFSPLEAARRNAITIGSCHDLASSALLHSSNIKGKGIEKRSFSPFSSFQKWIFGISVLKNPSHSR